MAQHKRTVAEIASANRRRMKTNLAKESTWGAVIRGVQEEFWNQRIHDTMTIVKAAAASDLSIGTVTRMVKYRTKNPAFMTILSMAKGLDCEIHINGAKVTVNGRVAKLKAMGVKPTIITRVGKPPLQVYNNPKAPKVKKVVAA